MFQKELISHAHAMIKKIAKVLPMATYISILLFENGDLVVRQSNNFNDWENKYDGNDMANDHVFSEIAHTKVKNHKSSVILWESVPYSSAVSKAMDEKRIKNGLHDGIAILEGLDGEHMLGINISSDGSINSNEFYARVIRKKDKFLSELKEMAGIK